MIARNVSHSRDRAVTRAAILGAAEQEFARYGLDAARIDEIAERSGVTKGMIYHYFGSKEKLYEAALEQIFAPLLMSLQPFAAPDADPEKAVEGVIRRILDIASRKPGVPAMLFLESIQNHCEYYDKIGCPSLYHVLATILEAGSKRGAFRPLDPWHTAINIVGACGFYYCASERLDPLLPAGAKSQNPEALRTHTDETIKLIMNGIRAVKASHDSAPDTHQFRDSKAGRESTRRSDEYVPNHATPIR